MQTSKTQFEEDQIIQITLKESMQNFPQFVPGTPKQEEEEYLSEEEMMRRALEMSKGE